MNKILGIKMRTIIVILFLSSFAFAQSISIGTAYQRCEENESFGASISPEIITFNNRKVIFRLYVGYLLGSNLNYSSNFDSYSRYEFGFESKNTMLTGKSFFNHIAIGYNFKNNKFANNDSGWMFSFGLGTRFLETVSIITKYVWNNDNGIRIVVEYDMF
jgi:hypothetical protein